MTTTGQRTAQLEVPAIPADASVMDAAFLLIKAGFYVGPIDLTKEHKNPGNVLGKGWQHLTSRDPQDIAAWFAGTNYGLFIHVGRSGAVVFDVDDYAQVPDVLRVELDRDDVPYQSTRVNDPGRGHYIFRMPPGRTLGNGRGGKDGLGGTPWGEIRGLNGVIVVEPTPHEKAATGGRYKLLRTGVVPVLRKHIADLLPDALDATDAATDAQVKAFLHACSSQRTKGHLMMPALKKFQAEVAAGHSRHESAIACAVWLLREARAGYYPADEAIEQLRHLFFAAIGSDRHPNGEWAGIVAWATAQALATPVAQVTAITAKTAQEHRLGARPAEEWPDGATTSRPAVASVEDALDVLDARKQAAAIPAPRDAPSADDGMNESSSHDDGMNESSSHNQDDQDDDQAELTEEPRRHRVDVTRDPEGLVQLVDAIDRGAIPQTYVRQGKVVRIAEFSGAADKKAKAVGSTTDVQGVDANILRLLLARHVDVIKWKAGKGDNPPEAVPASPAKPILDSVLCETHWPKLRPLNGVITAPVLRPDGSLLQEPGYDDSTGLYYSPAINIPTIPEHPTEEDVRGALELVLEEVLGDFPWQAGADLANYVALLMTPILRPYVGGLTPLGAISATERSSGKTLLTDILGQLFRMTSYAWKSDDKEIAKVITTALRMSTKPVVLWDNVGDRDAVDSPSLAKLLTSESWDDRLLGGNEAFEGLNDRLWLVTGNQIEFGGDIVSRTLLVRLDPGMPNPDLRTNFVVGDLKEWLKDDGNVASLLRALLILARAWIAAGGPRQEYAMRGFRQWACGVGGFLMHHGIGGFLDNREELRQHDEEELTWAAFCRTWHSKFGSSPQSTHDLVDSAKIQTPGFGLREDPWNGSFLTRANGDALSTPGLGKMLGRRRGRFFGRWQLRGEFDKVANGWLWAVYPVQDDQAPEAAG